MYIDFPKSPQLGDRFDTNNGCYEWDGSKWILSRVFPRKTLTTEEPPENPQIGQLWWDANLANLFIYYYNAWVPVGNNPKIYQPLPENGLHVLRYYNGTTYWEKIV